MTKPESANLHDEAEASRPSLARKLSQSSVAVVTFIHGSKTSLCGNCDLCELSLNERFGFNATGKQIEMANIEKVNEKLFHFYPKVAEKTLSDIIIVINKIQENSVHLYQENMLNYRLY